MLFVQSFSKKKKSFVNYFYFFSLIFINFTNISLCRDDTFYSHFGIKCVAVMDLFIKEVTKFYIDGQLTVIFFLGWESTINKIYDT